MKDAGFREQVVRQLRYPFPSDPIPLASPPERASPEVDDAVTERVECTGVRRHCVVREEAAHDLPQPVPLFTGTVGACAVASPP